MSNDRAADERRIERLLKDKPDRTALPHVERVLLELADRADAREHATESTVNDAAGRFTIRAVSPLRQPE